MSETKDREYIHELLSSTLEAPPDTTGDKLPRIGSSTPNIAPIEKPNEEAIENMKTGFKVWFYFLYTRLLQSIFVTLWTLCLLLAQFICILYFILWLLLNY